MSKPRRPRFPIHGWINLNKPRGMGSTEAVSAVKRLLHPEKIGHAGTLDPLAEGVLPLALGNATKTVPYMMDAGKIYRFIIAFGTRTETDDEEGAVIASSDKRPSKQEIEAALSKFLGNISQIPPTYSAIRIDGQRAYDLARAGEDVQMHSRKVHIEKLDLLDMPTADSAELRVWCGKGTYVRSLARDLAQVLGTEGHVSRLIREAVGPFQLEDAISLDFIEESVHNAPALEAGFRPAWLKPVISSLDDIPACEVNEASVAKLRTGQSISCNPPLTGDVAAIYRGELVALCEGLGPTLKPKRVFNN